MRVGAVVTSMLLLSLAVSGQDTAPEGNAGVVEDLRALFEELNEAALEGDRERLERLYAPEFLFVHATGYVDDRATHIDDSLTVKNKAPISIPDLERLQVLGDVAILRADVETRAGGSMFGTSIFVRRDGRWRIFQVQGTRMLPDRQKVLLAPEVLEKYVGRYENDAGESLWIMRNGADLASVLDRPNVPRRVLAPTSEGLFFDKLGAEYQFRAGEDGTVTQMIFRLNGREAIWTKVE